MVPESRNHCKDKDEGKMKKKKDEKKAKECTIYTLHAIHAISSDPNLTRGAGQTNTRWARAKGRARGRVKQKKGGEG